MKKFLVFVPCYNEESAIAPLSEKFISLNEELKKRGTTLHVTWVDDCSRDKTLTNILGTITTNPKLFSHIHHQTNKGLVGVLETVLDTLNRPPSEIYTNYIAVGLLDGDDSHHPITFLPMLEKLNAGSEVVIASRYRRGSKIHGVPAYRNLMSLGMSILFRLVGRAKGVRDYSCGFRIYSPSIIQRIGRYKFQKRSFACMVELLMACKKRGAKFAEVPFTLRYDLKCSTSKMRVIYTIKETLQVLLYQ